jgi:hypothetical protein
MWPGGPDLRSCGPFRETPFHENGQTDPFPATWPRGIPVRWPRQRSWITAHFEKWWAICRPPPNCRAARRCAAPFHGGAAHRWALVVRIHAGGDGRRSARECATPVGVATGRFALARQHRSRLRVSDSATSLDQVLLRPVPLTLRTPARSRAIGALTAIARLQSQLLINEKMKIPAEAPASTGSFIWVCSSAAFRSAPPLSS